ncbi:MAG: bacillithiol biosynthesis cysteine-adding enzyme BshC [Acidobacteriaceae bacterium]
MSEHCIPYTAIPHSSKLFLDYLFRFQNVSEFYARPANRSWLDDEAKLVHYDTERRARVAAVLDRQNAEFGVGEKTLEALQRFRHGAVVVVTGQQAGLFGGPLYSLLKAASSLNAAEELNRAGIPAVAVFWLATEDHDLPEIDHALFPSGPGQVRELRSSSKGQRNAPVGAVKFTAEIEEVVEEAAALLGESGTADDLKASYRAGETYGSAFGKLFARIFRDHGLVFLDPLDAEFHRIAAPIYAKALENAEALDKDLLARGKRLRDAGYHEQVKVTGESTLLFSMEGGERTVIHRANGGFLIGARRVARDELLQRVQKHPEEYSPNALLRPVVQDYLLPTVAYFGGAAEVAYFAQSAVVYQHLLGRVTPILARLSATLVNQRMQRLLKRYRLSLPDLFAGTENLKELLGSRVLPEGLHDTFDVTAEAIRENIQKMQDGLRVLDPSLVPAAEKAARKMKYQVERLRTKAARAELRRDQQLERDASELIAGLYPGKTLQERELVGISMLAAHGPGLLDRLIEAARTECGAHQVIDL